jgi:hypothetical protein
MREEPVREPTGAELIERWRRVYEVLFWVNLVGMVVNTAIYHHTGDALSGASALASFIACLFAVDA